MLCPSQLKLPSPRTTLQINNGFVMATLRCYTIKALDFSIHIYILLEHIIFLHPSSILKYRVHLR